MSPVWRFLFDLIISLAGHNHILSCLFVIKSSCRLRLFSRDQSVIKDSYQRQLPSGYQNSNRAVTERLPKQQPNSYQAVTKTVTEQLPSGYQVVTKDSYQAVTKTVTEQLPSGYQIVTEPLPSGYQNSNRAVTKRLPSGYPFSKAWKTIHNNRWPCKIMLLLLSSSR